MITNDAVLHVQGTPTQKTTITMVFHLTESSSETDPGLVELITVKRRIKNTIRNVFQTVWSI